MASTSFVDYNNSRANFDKLNPLIRSAYNNTFDFDEYKQKLLAKVEYDNQDGNSSFLDSIDEIRHEQRVRLVQVEHDYYNQKKTLAFDVPFYAQEEQKQDTIITSKPPIPIASQRSPSPVFVTEPPIQHDIHHHPISANIIRRHNDDIVFSPHRTSFDNTTSIVHDLSTSHVQNHIEDMWNEFELDDYIEQKK
jgi:hypothetical protein